MKNLLSLEGIRWIAIANQVSPVRLLTLVLAWGTDTLLTHIDIPAVNPTLFPTPRPLETVGVVVLCLPASLAASMLRDQLSWLTVSSPLGARGLRLLWLAVVTSVVHVLGALWLTTIPAEIPEENVAGVWCLILALSVLSVVAFGSDLAVVLPFACMIPFSVPGLVPFEANLIYNLDRVETLWLTSSIATVIAVLSFVIFGARRPDARA